jgi:protein phosphatase
MQRWQSACDSHPGARRAVNEDSVLSRPEIGLWVVADGMGGHAAGDVASRAITTALDSVAVTRCTLAQRVDEVDDALRDVNRELRALAHEEADGRTIGSTVVALLVERSVGVALWAGDSRLYRLREGQLSQITRDHNPMGDLLDDGLITERRARRADGNVITRAVGGPGDLFLDVAVFDIRVGDTFLLCSDGLYRELTEQEIGQMLAVESVDQSVRRMLSTCLERAARDNVSVVVSRTEC